MAQTGRGASRGRLARRSPRAASARPPAHGRPAARAVTAETGGMKPRPSGFVDNKLKQRVIQVWIQHGRASQRSSITAPGHVLRAAPTSNSTSLPPWSGFRRGTVDNATPRKGGRSPPSPLWGGVLRLPTVGRSFKAPGTVGGGAA